MRYNLAMRYILLFAALWTVGGCAQNSDDEAPQTKPIPPTKRIDKAVLGEWVTAATSAGHYDGVMHLSADGSFKEVDTFRRSTSKQSAEGTFTIGHGSKGEVVTITVRKLDGKAVSGGPPLELDFDRKQQILSNPFPGTIYSRRGNEARVRKLLGIR